MLNRIYRDQIARLISPALSSRSGFSDTDAAEKALEWLSAYLQGYLAKCLQTQSTGICDMTWKHDDCAVIMHMLHDITGDEKYKPKYGWD